MNRELCLVCNSRDIKTIIDLGVHPFADTFISTKILPVPEKIYPLKCDLCSKCGQIQTSCETNPSDRYSLVDYSYTSANSLFSKNHWKEYAREVTDKIGLDKSSFIVEVGSNDGYLLGQLSDMGYSNTIGIDPSSTMAQEAKKKYNVDTVIGFFEDIASSAHPCLTPAMKDRFVSKCDLIIANNVFNHSNSPRKMAKNIYNMLSDDGYFVYELPYWLVALKTKKFDQIYHEHVSYFTATSSYSLLKFAGLEIVDIEVVDYHGGSLRVYARKGKPAICENLDKMMKIENEYGTFNSDIYKEFMLYILKQRNLFMKNIYDIKLKNGNILAIGAAAKGNTFLNFYNLDNSIVDYVTDSSSFKQGKKTPLTRIPIVGDKIIGEYDEVYAIILSWNLADRLKDILVKINPKVKFISPEGKSGDE